MTIRRSMILLMTASLVSLAACNKKAEAPAASADANTTADATATPAAASSDPVKSALSAAPAAIAADASVVAPNPDGTMKVLREGKNGWTCMPDRPSTPGPDPMCMDANGMKWAEAWIGHKTPPADNVGLMYMLAGGTDASNTDPYATAPANGADWIKTGPHVMIVGADSLNKLYPSGDKPDTTKPSVMFGGTPYAHIMMPTG